MRTDASVVSASTAERVRAQSSLLPFLSAARCSASWAITIQLTSVGNAKETMAKTTTTQNRSFDLPQVLGDLRVPGLDLQALAESQRKNFEALTQANQLAIEAMRALTQRQNEIAQEAAEEASALLRDWTQPAAPEDRFSKSIEAAKLAFEKGIANVRELNSLGTKASADVFGVIARRVSEGFDEVRLFAKKRAAAE
jgi:phasin family protein